MQINQNKKDDLNLTVSFVLENADYEEARVKKLKNYRQRAELKGFRKGTAPMSLIERLYGPSALSETLQDKVSQEVGKFVDQYLSENRDLTIIGEPLPAERENDNDFGSNGTFTFDFDLGFMKKPAVEISAEDTIPYHEIKVAKTAIADYKENLLKQYGHLETGEAAGEEDFIIADFEQGENRVEDTYVALRSISDAEAKAMFVGKKAGESWDVDVTVAFPNETDRASMLKVKKEELAEMDPIWKVTVKEVKTFVNAAISQETFDQIFGAETVKSEEEFDAKVKERLAEEYAQESEARFSVDARDYFVKKFDVQIPEEFMKRWLLYANEGKFTMEDIEKEFQPFLQDYRWQVIRTEIMKNAGIQIKKEDLEAEAEKLAAYQFAMYGLNNVPQEQLKSFAQNILNDERQARGIYEKVENDKVMEEIRSKVTLDKKKVTLEQMRKAAAKQQ